jgi:hypothetical protein
LALSPPSQNRPEKTNSKKMSRKMAIRFIVVVRIGGGENGDRGI